MLDAIKPLLDSDLINEDTRQAISEQWEMKLNEARETIRAELRDEFAQRYEHDKSTMVEALDRMVSEGLQTELSEIAAEKQAIAEDRVKFQAKMKENSEKFQNFLVAKLAEELTELRSDRKTYAEGMEKLEQFIVGALAEEIKEFAADKQDVVETKVKLVREAREKLENLKARFIRENANKMERTVSKHLKAELSQLHEDIKVAKENNFGRRIFEAYAAEFGASHLNENAEMRKLQTVVAEQQQKLDEARKLQHKAKMLVESKEKQIRMIKESNERAETLDELLAPLNDQKRGVMANLLESVQTSRLKTTFEKYLPAVLAEGKATAKKEVVTESRKEVTGNKTESAKVESTDNNVIDLKRLAGL